MVSKCHAYKILKLSGHDFEKTIASLKSVYTVKGKDIGPTSSQLVCTSLSAYVISTCLYVTISLRHLNLFVRLYQPTSSKLVCTSLSAYVTGTCLYVTVSGFRKKLTRHLTSIMVS